MKKHKNFLQIIKRNGVKDCFTGDDSVSLSGEQKLLKEDINKEAKALIKEAIKNPDILTDFIQSKGTLIIKSKHMEKILKFFGETEGFILPMSGIKAILFTVVINKFSEIKLKTGFSTPALFALREEPVNIYTLAHQFHLWMSYINKLPGFEAKTMRNFKNFWESEMNSSCDTSSFAAEDLFALKDIIAREMEALDFVKEIGREFVGQKNSLKKLQDGKSINL